MRPKVGISACLLGERVRYDGGHRQAKELVATLRQQVELIPVCPEVGAGMGVPREPFHLEDRGHELIAITNHTQRDVTGPLLAFARQEVARLAALGLHGFVSKARSPSCGYLDTPLSSQDEDPARGSGLFIAELLRQLPDLPLASEASLNHAEALGAFLCAVRARAQRPHAAE